MNIEKKLDFLYGGNHNVWPLINIKMNILGGFKCGKMKYLASIPNDTFWAIALAGKEIVSHEQRKNPSGFISFLLGLSPTSTLLCVAVALYGNNVWRSELTGKTDESLNRQVAVSSGLYFTHLRKCSVPHSVDNSRHKHTIHWRLPSRHHCCHKVHIESWRTRRGNSVFKSGSQYFSS